jgi:hypothetical protein
MRDTLVLRKHSVARNVRERSFALLCLTCDVRMRSLRNETL